MTRRSGRVALALLGVGLAGCAHDFEPPDRGERVEQVSALYSSEMFDTIAWDDDAVRSLRGNTVYAEQCRRCHGTLGEGATEYARGRGLIVPSLTRPEWTLEELDSLRLKLYVGHEEGMPIFGDGRLSPREIDATAGYILETLRPEVARQR